MSKSEATTKRCNRCKVQKPLDEFYSNKTGRRAGTPHSVCIPCANEDCKDYQRRKKVGLLRPKSPRKISPTETRCSACREIKNNSEFYKLKTGEPVQLCKICSYQKQVEWKGRMTLEERKAYNRLQKLKEFGLTPEDFTAMVRIQGGKCLICNRIPNGILCIDHDHKTGKVRGLLCHRCNLALGVVEKYFVSCQKYLAGSRGAVEGWNKNDVSSEDMIDWDHEYYGVNA